MFPEDLTATSLKTRLRHAERRKAQALADFQAANAELTWLKEGLRLFEPGVKRGNDGPETIVTELFPDGDIFGDGLEPSLRQAIVIVMREHPGRQWTVPDLAEALDAKSWLPANPTKRISDMAGDMVRLGQAQRVDRGTYELAPELVMALEVAMPGPKE